MSQKKVYVGDTGTLIRFMFSAAEDFPSGPVSAVIEYKKPDGTTGSWPATVTPAPDPDHAAFVDYTTQAGDLDQDGTWWLQVRLDSPSWRGRSNTVKLVVYAPFE